VRPVGCSPRNKIVVPGARRTTLSLPKHIEPSRAAPEASPGTLVQHRRACRDHGTTESVTRERSALFDQRWPGDLQTRRAAIVARRARVSSHAGALETRISQDPLLSRTYTGRRSQKQTRVPHRAALRLPAAYRNPRAFTDAEATWARYMPGVRCTSRVRPRGPVAALGLSHRAGYAGSVQGRSAHGRAREASEALPLGSTRTSTSRTRPAVRPLAGLPHLWSASASSSARLGASRVRTPLLASAAAVVLTARLRAGTILADDRTRSDSRATDWDAYVRGAGSAVLVGLSAWRTRV
jgi:hypothetical protein